MKKLYFIFIFSLFSLISNAQIQTKFWDLTLGVSSYKQVNKYCNQFKGHYRDPYGDFWGNTRKTKDNERNDDPLKGEVFIRPFNLINFAGEDWKVKFIFENKILSSIEMVLSRYSKKTYQDFRGRTHSTDEPVTYNKVANEEYLNSLINALMEKYEAYFQPKESKEENAYIFYDGNTICKLQLNKNGYLTLSYTDEKLLNANKQSKLDEL